MSVAKIPTPVGVFPNPAHPELLATPVARAAYSNRTAWVMANMARMAYYKFEGHPDLITVCAAEIANLKKLDAKDIEKKLGTFLDQYTQTQPPGLAQLENELKAAGYTLKQTFNRGGTQAFLAVRETDKTAVIAFRGTEKSIADIKTDLEAGFFKTDNGTMVHEGFRKAYAQVAVDIQQAYAGLSDYKVYITGHSLGGALATLATYALDADTSINTDNLAACYTYGCPRVGTGDLAEGLRTPVYRVVNDVDVVPRLPPSYVLDFILWILKFFRIPYLTAFLEKFQGYRHVGDMRYLSATTCGDYSDVEVFPNPDVTDRIAWAIKSLLKDSKAGVKRHSSQEYCDKLEAYVLKQPLNYQPPPPPPPAASSIPQPPTTEAQEAA